MGGAATDSSCRTSSCAGLRQQEPRTADAAAPCTSLRPHRKAAPWLTVLQTAGSGSRPRCLSRLGAARSQDHFPAGRLARGHNPVPGAGLCPRHSWRRCPERHRVHPAQGQQLCPGIAWPTLEQDSAVRLTCATAVFALYRHLLSCVAAALMCDGVTLHSAMRPSVQQLCDRQHLAPSTMRVLLGGLSSNGNSPLHGWCRQVLPLCADLAQPSALRHPQLHEDSRRPTQECPARPC